MKQLRGFASNFNDSIVGKVTKKRKGIINRKDYIPIINDSIKYPFGYAGIIKISPKSKSPSYEKKPTILFSDPSIIEEFNENDVIKMEPNGDVIVLWENGSQHNPIFLTERCNCRCMTCPQPPQSEDKDLFQLNMRLLNLIEAKDVEHIGITGGEPTLVGEQLFKILELCRDKFPETTISLLTNGKLFNNFNFAKRIAEIDHPKLIICVSISSDTDTEHDKIVGAKRSFNETIEGLHNLALLKQKIEIRIVIHLLNHNRLPQLSDFVYRNFPFAIHVAFMGMEITGLCLDNIKDLWIDPYEYRELLRTAVRQLDRALMKVSIYNIPLCLLAEDMWFFARRSISPWKNSYLPICESCCKKSDCCGIFSTSGNWQSRKIHPII
jgi:His-Xaa-Ser system radical SAM maturase HxsC